jgi:hypothetical protein
MELDFFFLFFGVAVFFGIKLCGLLCLPWPGDHAVSEKKNIVIKIMIIKFKKYKYSVHFYCQNQRLKCMGRKGSSPLFLSLNLIFFQNDPFKLAYYRICLGSFFGYLDTKILQCQGKFLMLK